MIALVGEVGSWLPSGFEVHVPCAGPLGDRLDHTFRSVGQVAFLIGMGTPQITAPLLELALASMRANRLDVLVGPSDDGGFWSLGPRDPLVDVCHDVPMSRDDTYSLLRVGLRRRWLTCGVLPTLVDVDDFATAREVATDIPGSGFATMIATISAALRLDSIGARP